MKIIDLLNRIANGEEVPKKIKYSNDIYIQRDNYCYYCDETDLFLSDRIFVEQSILNDEVEILEEPKGIPEKLRTWYSVEEKQSLEENCEFANCNFETMYEKINEIIDFLEYLESKGE